MSTGFPVGFFFALFADWGRFTTIVGNLGRFTTIRNEYIDDYTTLRSIDADCRRVLMILVRLPCHFWREEYVSVPAVQLN